MDAEKFFPFYERIACRIPGYIFRRVLVSAILGLVFLAVHCLSIGNQAFGIGRSDWSWFLGILISTAMLCLYYATHTLRAMFPKMNARLNAGGKKFCMQVVMGVLSDYNFVRIGLIFGLLNCAFGFSFGLPYSHGLAIWTILFGYFLAGFVCGMAVWGIYGVFVAIRAFSREARDFFDFTSPDHCGGTLFLGEALIKFGSVTFIVGVMISVYILKTHWTRETTLWITSLQGFWIVFPYLASLFAYIGPAVPISEQLKDYKIEQERILQERLHKIQQDLEDEAADSAKRKDLREDYEFRQNKRKQLHSMWTWPFDFGAHLRYVIVLGANSLLHKYVPWLTK